MVAVEGKTLHRYLRSRTTPSVSSTHSNTTALRNGHSSPPSGLWLPQKTRSTCHAPCWNGVEEQIGKVFTCSLPRSTRARTFLAFVANVAHLLRISDAYTNFVPAINRLVHLLSVGDKGDLCSRWRYSRCMIQEMARLPHQSYVFVIGVNLPSSGQNMASLCTETWRILMQASSPTLMVKFSDDNIHLTRALSDIGQRKTLSQLLESAVVLMKAHLKGAKSGGNVSVQTAQRRQRPSCSFACRGPWPLIDQGDPKGLFWKHVSSKSPRGGTSMCSAMDNHRRAHCHCAPPAVEDSNNSLCLPVRVQHLHRTIHKLVFIL